MSAPPLSNRLADLAERAGNAFRRGGAKSIEAATEYLESGKLLAEAKDECGHGLWLPFLERAGVAARTAQRLMQLAKSGMTAETLAQLGLRAAAASLAEPRNTPRVAHLKADASPESIEGVEPSPDTPPAPQLGLPMTGGGAASPSAERSRARRAVLKSQGLCVDCGEPADGHTRCLTCRKTNAKKGRRGRRLSKSLDPRLEEAARKGTGLELTPAEVAELVADK